MHIAAIDIGTNSVHMIVARVRPDRSFEVIDREKEMVRLGAGGLDGRALTDGAMSAALQALTKFKRLADSHRVEEILAVATSATREAENGGDFLSAVERDTGVRPRVITGTEEARLIHLAAGYGIDLAGGEGVVIDIGGGSVEITCGPAAAAVLAESFKVGVIRLTERFVRSDPLSERDHRRLVKHINGEVGAHVDAIAARGFQRVIGTSGTILSLGALAAADSGAAVPTDLRNLRVSAKALRRLRKRLLALDLRERLELPGLDPRRADLSVAGIVLLETIVRRLKADELVLCDLALREGLILDYVQRHRSHISTAERYPDIRRRSVVELGERCRYWSDHAHHVARLALQLFDGTRSLHGLGDRERELLEYGALLHDVGVHISYKGHHKHSYYLIRNGDLRGFEPDEVEVIGLIARYHRQGTPKKSHDGVRKLRPSLRRVVKLLSGFVRLAEGLDRSHAQLVTHLGVHDRGRDCVVELRTHGDTELELWAANRQVAPLEALLNRIIRFEVVTASHAEQPAEDARVSRKAPGGGGHRRLRQDDAARTPRQVAGRGRAPRVRDRVELVGARPRRHARRKEEEHAHADDLQPPARD